MRNTVPPPQDEQQDRNKNFDQRMQERKASESKEDASRTETLRQAYLRRTKRSEMKP